MGRLFDPEWDREKKGRAAGRREAERMLARNRELQRQERGTFLAAERERTQQRFNDAISAQLDQGRDGDAGPNRILGDGPSSSWGRHQATEDAFKRAEARRAAKEARAEGRRAMAGKQGRFSTTPAGFYGSKGNRNVQRASDTDARRAIRERFKGEIAATEAAKGRRAKLARERKLADAAAKKASKSRATQITKLGGRDLLVETSQKKVLQKQLAQAAARGQKVSIMPRFSFLGRGKGSDGVVGQGDDEVRLWARGWDADKVMDRVMNPKPGDTYAPGDFNGFMEQQATRVGGVEGARGLLGIKLNVWDEAEPELDDPDVEYPY